MKFTCGGNTVESSIVSKLGSVCFGRLPNQIFPNDTEKHVHNRKKESSLTPCLELFPHPSNVPFQPLLLSFVIDHNYSRSCILCSTIAQQQVTLFAKRLETTALRNRRNTVAILLRSSLVVQPLHLSYDIAFQRLFCFSLAHCPHRHVQHLLLVTIAFQRAAAF